MENKENNKNIDDSFLFSTSLIFDENIDKLWLHFRDLSLHSLIIDYLDDFKYIKGENTWTIGNICSAYWIGVSHLKVRCIFSQVDGMKKKIKWRINCDIGLDFYKTLYLYRITQDDKTMVKLTFSRTNKSNKSIDFNQSKKYYLELEYNVLLAHYKYLKNIKNDIISYGSCVINQNYLKIWNVKK